MIAVVLTLITSAIFWSGEQMDAVSALIMAGGSLVGVYWGSKCSVKVPEKVLKGVIAAIVLIAAVCMLVVGSH